MDSNSRKVSPYGDDGNSGDLSPPDMENEIALIGGAATHHEYSKRADNEMAKDTGEDETRNDEVQLKIPNKVQDNFLQIILSIVEGSKEEFQSALSALKDFTEADFSPSIEADADLIFKILESNKYDDLKGKRPNDNLIKLMSHSCFYASISDQQSKAFTLI
jgi:hypothetical protein